MNLLKLEQQILLALGPLELFVDTGPQGVVPAE
jgi:hypothetical protein